MKLIQEILDRLECAKNIIIFNTPEVDKNDGISVKDNSFDEKSSNLYYQ